jgi:Zn-dependent protease
VNQLDTADARIGSRCDACGTDIAPGLLSCPGCHRLVHASTLKDLQQRALAAAQAGDVSSELAAWRSIEQLIPPDSRQFATVSGRIAALTTRSSSDPASAPLPRTGPWKWLGGLGIAGLLLWKFKFLVVLFATKGKLLLLGLTKASTVFSMALSVGVYWTAWGLWFALGLVVSIYVHEMGHVASLRRFGHDATAPMFVPGVGAFIRMRGRQLRPYEDARIGLAGPLWGLAAALASLAIWWFGGSPMYAAIASTGAWINLFNLLPVWQLDGNRGFTALARRQRWVIVLAFAAAWMFTGDGLLILLLIMAIVRVFDAQSPATGDRAVLAEFTFLILALATVFWIARV